MKELKLPDINAVHRAFIGSAVAHLRQQQERIEDCLSRLNDDQIWSRGNENSNAVGNLILHLVGNLGQWVLSGIGGVPDLRERDLEFATRDGLSRDELVQLLRARMDEVVKIIEAVPAERLLETVNPQGYSLPVMEVITHITEHFYYHGGQILLLTKLMLDVDLGYYKHLKGNNKQHTAQIP